MLHVGFTILRLICNPGISGLFRFNPGITKTKISQTSPIFTIDEYHNLIEKIINAKIQTNLYMKIHKDNNL